MGRCWVLCLAGFEWSRALSKRVTLRFRYLDISRTGSCIHDNRELSERCSVM